MAKSCRGVAKWILRNTLISRESLTPEIRLRLITEQSSLWRSDPDLCPFVDPFWAIYWPGGQAITRYILDNETLFYGAHVLDFGCGCGSASIAATMVGAIPIANDIDNNALIATTLNYRLNGISAKETQFISDDLLTTKDNSRVEEFLAVRKSFIVLGDMFYDTDFAEKVLAWLYRLKQRTATRILIGDPNRHPLNDEQLKSYETSVIKKQLKSYSLPEVVMREHYGFSGVNSTHPNERKL
ncbi:unnamed protein product [Cylicocyclus nassatus]|uniref:ETFB lysine methyltransferase n=1 Tax=Cylicocyclus nassatus TaxID=53992 RepID=A0AA36LYS8_CYLNA|nr:unnamed protein product [Cylicocyclus nassatus]